MPDSLIITSTNYNNPFICRFDMSVNRQLKSVPTYHFFQDALEIYLGRQRLVGRGRDNANLRTFGYQDST